MDSFKVYSLGTVPYQEALSLQLSLLDKRKNNEICDTLLLLQHPPTFTTGRGGKMEHILRTGDELAADGIHYEVISRGGDVTYHGPGQLVGYAIIDLTALNRDVHKFLRSLEELIIIALGDFGIHGGRNEGLTGVWADGQKVASIGVGVKRWITYHGFALNVNTDLSYFDMIVPCGIQGVRIASLKKLLGRSDDVPMEDVERRIIDAFAKVFGRRLHGIIRADEYILDGAFDATFPEKIELNLKKDTSKLTA